MNKPILLIVMDGVGLSPDGYGDAVSSAHTPLLDRLMADWPNIAIKAHGTAVGLPSDEDMGNSEVGHNALGSGQIYAQGAKLVNESMASGAIFESDTWNEIVANTRQSGGTLHLIGLLSDGNVHSHLDHVKQLISQAKDQGISKVRVHALLDGRDVPATSALVYIDDLNAYMSKLNDSGFDARFASGGGRMKITMDRYEADWEMVERGWQTHVLGVGRTFASANEAVETLREENPGVIDQDLPPFVIANEDGPVGTINDGDSVIFFNFRGDRALEISQAFESDDSFDKFNRVRVPKVFYAGMLEYDGDLHIPSHYLVNPPSIHNTLTEFLIRHEKNEYAISETQKFGHVTYFWNGNRTEKFDERLETYYEVPSDRVSFDERPWMKSAEITDQLIAALVSHEYDFLRVNYPNGDMVGHTGKYQSVEIAVESVDLALSRLLPVADKEGYLVIITADHGNADDMWQRKLNPDGSHQPKTAHSLNPVPFIVVDKDRDIQFKEGEFGLANVASTVVTLMGLEAPEEWEPSMI